MDIMYETLEKKSDQVDILWKALLKIRYTHAITLEEAHKIADGALDKIALIGADIPKEEKVGAVA